MRSRERGAALVEAALVLPFVILLLMGIVDFGRVFLAEITLNNAVSEGALFGAQFPGDPGDIQDRVVDAGADLELATGDVTVTCVDIDSVEHVEVEATADIEMLTPVGQWFGASITLTSDATGINTQEGTTACVAS